MEQPSMPTESRSGQVVARKRYSVREIHEITRQAARTRPFLRRSSLGGDRQFTERVMLAVTEVNGCEICSYAHARFALDAGLSEGEIRALLGGSSAGAPDHQLPAIAFAQHYADTRGRPDPSAWSDLVDTYGEREASGILAATRLMMWGNAVGIPLSSLRARLKGRRYPGSTVRYELGTLGGSIAAVPFGLAHALLSRIRRESIAPGSD